MDLVKPKQIILPLNRNQINKVSMSLSKMSSSLPSIMNELTPHPHTPQWFQTCRPEVYDFCLELIEARDLGITHILVKAQVKSGKKDIVEGTSSFLGPTTKVFYITALNRKDVKKQVEELNLYNVSTHVVNSDAAVKTLIATVNAEKARNMRVIICLDECDYGSGDTQKLSGAFREFLNDTQLTKVYFSATAHETEVSSLRERPDFRVMEFHPPANYIGAEWFLNEELVFDTDTFFVTNEDNDIILSEHAKLVLIDSIDENRHIGVVRINGDFTMKDFKRGTTKRNLERQLQGALPSRKPWEIIPVDAVDSHDWEDRKTRNMYVNDNEVNYLFILKQTCGRGTDLKGWHHKLAFWHDARSHNGNSRPNTLIQAFGRPFHYSASYGGVPQRIRIYCDMVVMELAAYDDLESYLGAGGKPPSRTVKQRMNRVTDISPMSFSTMAEARVWALTRMSSASAFGIHINNGVHQILYRGSPRDILSEEETRSYPDISWGCADSARLMPVFAPDRSIRWIVVYKRTDREVEEPKVIEATNKSMYDLS